MPRASTEELVPYIDRLRELPFVQRATCEARPRSPDRGADARVELELVDGSSETLLVEHRSSHLPAHAAPQLRHRFAHDHDRHFWIVAAPYVGAPLGDSFEASGVNFIDRQGNCHLRIGDRFVARIQARPAPKHPARTKEIRAPGYQVMFTLLADPELVSGTQREIATAAGTSRQPVADLLERFRQEALVVRRGHGYAWAKAPDAGLLERFVAGYRSTLRPKLFVGRFRVPARTPSDIEAWLDERLGAVRYGGTAGAHRLRGHYRGPLTVAHLGPLSEETRRRIKAAPSEEGDLLWVDHIGEASSLGATPDTVHPLLIYAELVSDPDPRAIEAAEVVREGWLPWSL